MERKGRVLLWVFFLIPLAVTPELSAQQNQIGKIIGSVRVLRGDFPSHPVMVTLEMRGAPIASAYCDDRGSYGFYNLIANQYKVTVNDPDYEPVSETTDLNPEFSTTNLVQITLIPRPKDKDKKDPLTGRVEGANPYLVDPAEYLRQFPKKTVKEFEKGVDADHHGNTDEAVQHYEKALSYSPNFYPANNNLGSLYLARQNYDAAQVQFEAAQKANQNDVEAYFNLANVFITTQRYPAAERQLEDGLQRRPNSAFGHFLQGLLYSRTNHLDLAEKSLQSALQLDPKMSQAYLQLVNLYLLQKRTPEAIAELESYLKTFPDTPYSPKARETLKRLQASAAAGPQ